MLQTDLVASAVLQAGGIELVSSAVLQAGVSVTVFIISSRVSKYVELSVVVLQTTEGVNCTVFTSAVIVVEIRLGSVQFLNGLCWEQY